MAKYKAIDAPIKYIGGKYYLRNDIVSLFPDREDYLTLFEPFFGSGAVMLAHDPAGRIEVANDLNGTLINFWRVLQNKTTSDELAQILLNTPVARVEFDAALTRLANPIDATNKVRQAADFFIANRQSISAQAEEFTRPVLTRLRRAMSDNISAWGGALDNTFEKVRARIQRIFIENMPALELIQRFGKHKRSVWYIDCPYVQETRVSPKAYKEFEMAELDHLDLLAALKQVKGFVLVSGYPSALYDRELESWHRYCKPQASHAGQGKTKTSKLEVVWCNFQPPKPSATMIRIPDGVSTMAFKETLLSKSLPAAP